jgi:acetyl-CoA carboxylase biotin carboxyl carrier protein
MLDIRKLKELVRLMVANDLSEIDLRDSDEQVTLRRHGPDQPPHLVAAPPVHVSQAAVAPAAAATATAGTPSEAGDADEQGLTRIETPMVGTFYSAPNPDSKPFVAVGSAVGPDTVVCLVEAMKIFNEIKAECSGKIEKVMVNNSDSVEFGQALFLVRPN